MQRTETKNPGCHLVLTNNYSILGLTGESSLEDQLKDYSIPVIRASVGGMSILGSLIAGNSRGCVISSLASDQELQHIRRSLPASVKVVQLQDQFCTTPGNLILSNDSVAIVSEQFDQVTRDIIGDTLGTDVLIHSLENGGNLNSYCLLNNNYCGVGIQLSQYQLQSFADVVQVPASMFTAGKGHNQLGREVVLNDFFGVCGPHSTSVEVNRIEKNFLQLTVDIEIADMFEDIFDGVPAPVPPRPEAPGEMPRGQKKANKRTASSTAAVPPIKKRGMVDLMKPKADSSH